MPNDTVRASDTALPKSRRAALGLFASASAIAVMPAVAQAASLEVDPIFAAIKRHHEAWRAFGATCSRTDNAVARNEGREVTEADEAAWTAANEREEEAFEGLVTLSPVTMPGLRAAMHYFIEFETECIPGATDKFLTALLASPLLSIGRPDDGENITGRQTRGSNLRRDFSAQRALSPVQRAPQSRRSGGSPGNESRHVRVALALTLNSPVAAETRLPEDG